MSLDKERKNYQETILPNSNKDFFLSHPPRRPKIEIADYWDSRGVRTPRRFDFIEDALASEKPFIIRSEHPQDYDSSGVSGLMESYFISTLKIEYAKRAIDKLKQAAEGVQGIRWSDTPMTAKDLNSAALIAQIGKIDQEELEAKLTQLSAKKIDRYVELTGINKESFLSDLSYSYWELLGGINRTIISDNTIQGRYYIFSSFTDSNTGISDGGGFHIIENNKILLGKTTGKLKNDKLNPQKATEFYESLRNIDGFDPNHCPIIEAQSIDEEYIPLQYHRTRDFQPATHVLDRDKASEEFTPSFIRGSTPPEGTIFEVNVYTRRHSADNLLLPSESALDYNQVDPVRTGIMASRRKLQLVEISNPNRIGILASSRHMAVSQLFKPEITVGIHEDFLPKNIFSSVKNNRLKVKVVSDGNRAFIEYLD